MPFGLKILDRHVCREFLVVLAGVVGACAVILLIAKIFEEFDKILETSIGWIEAVKYFAYVLPYRVLEIVPLATVLAVIFSVGTLARNRELLAVTASGRSPFRSAVPVLASAVVISFVIIGLNETVVPYCQERVNAYERGVLKGRGTRYLTTRTDIFEKGVGTTFFMMSAFDAATNTMIEPLIWRGDEKDPTRWTYSLYGRTARLVRHDAGPHEDLWRFEGAIETRYDSKGQPLPMVVHKEVFEQRLEAGLDQYLSNRKEPDQMNLVELRRYIQTLQLRNEDVSIYLTDWYLKLAFPFSTVILAMIAFALAARAHTASLPMAFGKGVALTMLFYALAALGQTLGHVAALPPLAGSLGPLGLFAIVGVLMIRRSGFAS